MTARSQEPRFVEYADDALPAEQRWQVLSFLRIVWPEGFTGDLRYRDEITNSENHPYHLLYVAGSLVVSHLEIASPAALPASTSRSSGVVDGDARVALHAAITHCSTFSARRSRL